MPLEIQWTTVVTSLTVAIVTWLAKTLIGWVKESRERDERLASSVEALTRATQVNMRQSLIHSFEKYYGRGWATPEERAAWVDMYEAYHSLGANGLIDSYRTKLDSLDDREIGG